MINHRGPEFAALLDDCVAGLRWTLQTTGDVLLFGASGTGGLEAVVANLLSPGERALFCTNGWFGELWARMAEAYRVDVVRLAAPWGCAIDPGELALVLDAEPAITKVFVTHNETSTGVLNDIPAIAGLVKARGCLLAVDSVSGVPCHPLPVDELGLDVVVTSSQKGWLAPPGLTMIAASAAAMDAAAQATSPRWYFDFLQQKDCHDRGLSGATPPISVMYALKEGLAMIHEEGLHAMWERHARIGRMTRRGLTVTGLELVAAAGSASSTVTAVHSPCSSPAALAALLSDLRLKHGLVLADGLGQMAGRTFRIGHLGQVFEADILAMLRSLEQGLAQRVSFDAYDAAASVANDAAGEITIAHFDLLVRAGHVSGTSLGPSSKQCAR